MACLSGTGRSSGSITKPSGRSAPKKVSALASRLEDHARLVGYYGRGAIGNPSARYNLNQTSPFDDGWSTPAEATEAQQRLMTTLSADTARRVISWNASPDIGFDRALNPYRGCEHGCIYCYARPTHAYYGFSPGLDFETKLMYKPQVAALLEKELRNPGYRPNTLVLGSNTDPYQPVERTLKLTRASLEVLSRFSHPVSIVTKSAGVLRDIEILSQMAQRGLVRVHLSVTTLDSRLARIMEPRAASPARRLYAIEQLTRAGIPTGVLAAPIVPALNDAELEKIVEAGALAGALHADFILLRLPLELRQIFEAWLRAHFPYRARRVLNLIREMRGGELNDSRFYHRFAGQGVYADLLVRRFARACRQFGLNERRAELRRDLFAVPERPGTERGQQMSLL